jgi:hypothetical protein
MVSVMLVLGPAAELLSTHPAQVVSTHPAQVVSTDPAAIVASAHYAKMSAAQPAAMASGSATTGKRIGRNAGASHRHGGNDDRDSVQHKFLHGSFLSG